MSILSPVTVIVAAPNADSFDHVVARRFRSVLGQAGVRCHDHDLYAESFDPVLTETGPAQHETGAWTRGVSSEQIAEPAQSPNDPLIDRHRRELIDAKSLAIMHPDWLGKPPAILVGWLDRVLAPVMAARDSGNRTEHQLERVLVMITRAGAASAAAHQRTRDPLDSLWREEIGTAIGTPDVEVMQFRPIATAQDDQRRQWLNGVERAAAWICGADR